MLNPPVGGWFTYESGEGDLRVGRPLTYASLSCREHQPQPKVAFIANDYPAAAYEET
jgi:hypothetical protein